MTTSYHVSIVLNVVREVIGDPPAAPIVIVLNWRQLLVRADSRGDR